MKEVVLIGHEEDGLSVKLVTDQVEAGLSAQGWAVERLPRTAKSLAPAHQKLVLCLEPTLVSRLLADPRYLRPKALASLFVTNLEEMAPLERLPYAGAFLSKTYAGIPVQHLVHSAYTEQAFNAYVQGLFQPSHAREFRANQKTLWYGISDDFKPGPADPDLLVAPMNRVAVFQKRCDLHAEITGRYLLASQRQGRRPTCRFFHVPGAGPSDKSCKFDRSAYEFQEQPAREAYPAKAREHGLFLSTSEWESFGIYYLELLASGVVGVFLDRPWVRTLLPSYRFVASKADLLPMMLHVRQHWDEARRYVIEEVRPWIMRERSLRAFHENLDARLTALSTAAES